MSSFSSGRDSSDIEYSCDYNLQMNFSQWEHRGSKKEEQLSSRQELMNRNPRKISITIHKNRLGENGKILDFEFNPIRNTFEPKEEKKETSSTTMKL